MDDFWTTSGVHYRFDGTKLGTLAFADQSSQAPPHLSALQVGPRGQVYATGEREDIGWFLSAHDATGRQIWIRPLGHPVSPKAAKGPIHRNDQEPPRAGVSFAQVVGVSEAGTVLVSGWLQGCVDLASPSATFVDCATLDRAGKNLAPGEDAFPQLFFASRFDEKGTWRSSQSFPRLPVTGSAWSMNDDVFAVAAGGRWPKSFFVRAPDGKRVALGGDDDGNAYTSAVLLVDHDGHLRSLHRFRAGAEAIVRGLAFDATGQLWLLIDSSPVLDIKTGASSPAGIQIASCSTVLSLGRGEEHSSARAAACVPTNLSGTISPRQSLTTAADRRVIVSLAPDGFADGDTLAPPRGLSAVSRDRLRLVVTRAGAPDWSSQIPTENAIGLPNGWTCFSTLENLACVRPAAADGNPSDGDQPGKDR
jgi:hypothetical protein